MKKRTEEKQMWINVPKEIGWSNQAQRSRTLHHNHVHPNLGHAWCSGGDCFSIAVQIICMALNIQASSYLEDSTQIPLSKSWKRLSLFSARSCIIILYHPASLCYSYPDFIAKNIPVWLDNTVSFHHPVQSSVLHISQHPFSRVEIPLHNCKTPLKASLCQNTYQWLRSCYSEASCLHK